MKLADVLRLRDDFLSNDLDINFYDYQTEISDKIIEAIINRSGQEIPIEVSRQAGKTEAVVCTIAFLMTFALELTRDFWGYEAPIRIIIFAPQKEQCKTDFDRLKLYLGKLKNKGWGDIVDAKESNQTTLQITNGSYCYIFPLTPTSSPESKTADLIIYEEAHKIIDSEKNNKAEPMGASTNAPQISIGVGWYQKNDFKRLIDRYPDHIRITAPQVIEARRRRYEIDHEARHLLYESFFNKKLVEAGKDDLALRTQYLLEWVLEAGQLMTATDWDDMIKPYTALNDKNEKYKVTAKLLDEDRVNECYAGIDTAKHPDSTVVTIIRWNKKTNWKELVAVLELHGTNYGEQFTIISGFDTVEGRPTGQGMFDYFNIVGIAIDSTGQGSFMPDMFKLHTQFRDEKSGLFEVKFSLVGKDMIYTNLIQVINNRLTAIPSDDTVELRKCRQQCLDMQKEYKGQFLSCHHPDGTDGTGQGYHDDYPDSWALAEHAFALQQRIAKPNIRILG